jgi:hypothetical protein
MAAKFPKPVAHPMNKRPVLDGVSRPRNGGNVGGARHSTYRRTAEVREAVLSILLKPDWLRPEASGDEHHPNRQNEERDGHCEAVVSRVLRPSHAVANPSMKAIAAKAAAYHGIKLAYQNASTLEEQLMAALENASTLPERPESWRIWAPGKLTG